MQIKLEGKRSGADLARKAKAYRELFGRAPAIKVARGYWSDTKTREPISVRGEHESLRWRTATLSAGKLRVNLGREGTSLLDPSTADDLILVLE